ncbi:MAG: hypothetical protein AAF637_26185 [Pseudomonadota bacterium]
MDEAKAALRTFLASFGIGRSKPGDLLVQRLLAGALRHDRHHPRFSAAEWATLYAEEQFEAWLRAVLAPETPETEHRRSTLAVGRAAFLACGGPTRWHQLILVRNQLPEAFLVAMRSAMPPLAPMHAPRSMEAQALDSWSIAEICRGLLDALGSAYAWSTNAPLVATSIKLVKSRS